MEENNKAIENLTPEQENIAEETEILQETVPTEAEIAATEAETPEESYCPNDTETPPAPIFTPVSVGAPVQGKNGGLRLFIAVLCIILALCMALAGGYIVGRNYDQGTNTVVNVDLAERPDVSEQQTALQVYENAKHSVVGVIVYSKDGRNQSLGSGIIYSEDGYIVTNDHLLTNVVSPSFIVTTFDGTDHEATFIASDVRSDLAVLKIEGTFSAVELGNSDSIIVGEKVAAIGYPAGVYEKPILTLGCISSVSRRVSSTSAYSSRVIQTDAAINAGSSGGALLNMYGQVIGVTASKQSTDEAERVGFAVPSKTVKTVVEALIKDKCVKDRAKLGVSYYEITSAGSKLSNLPTGLYVAEIAADSDLGAKGVKVGDIITHVNDVKVTNESVALDLVDSKKAGDTLKMTIYQTDTQKSVSVTITLISDPGSSSYTTKETASSNSGIQEDDNSFDFPLGE